MMDFLSVDADHREFLPTIRFDDRHRTPMAKSASQRSSDDRNGQIAIAFPHGFMASRLVFRHAFR
jgi:hypothetical protein